MIAKYRGLLCNELVMIEERASDVASADDEMSETK
jgi:hypothetical protein